MAQDQGRDRKRKILVGASALAAGLMVLTAFEAHAAEPAAPQPDYHPSLADIMTMAVQPRHTKLGVAGRARDWPYLAYEARELRGAFNRVVRTVPTFNKTDMADMVAANMKDPLDQIDAAIKARNGAAFDAAYAKITNACNVCHKGLDKEFVVIRAPVASPYADQSFAPARPR